jgi:hypothetical protein
MPHAGTALPAEGSDPHNRALGVILSERASVRNDSRTLVRPHCAYDLRRRD